MTWNVQDPWRSSSGPGSTFAGAAALLQLCLLQTYLLLPSATAYAPEHATLLRLCASALKGPSTSSGWTCSCGKCTLVLDDRYLPLYLYMDSQSMLLP